MEWNLKNYRNKKVDSDQTFGDKYLKTKIKSHNDKITESFHGKAPKKGIESVYLLAIVIDSASKSGKNYCPQKFLEECKYKIKVKNTKQFIKVNLFFWRRAKFWAIYHVILIILCVRQIFKLAISKTKWTRDC